MAIIGKSPVSDERKPIDKARRPQLIAFAHENGQMDINESMDAEMIRMLLKERGLTRIQVQRRPLGSTQQEYMGKYPEHERRRSGGAPEIEKGRTVTAEELTRERYRAQQAREKAQKDIMLMSINQLRDACKQRGIKLERTDNVQSLREKLGVENAA